MEPCVIGVDGGGTRSTAICCRMDGTILAEKSGGPLNFNTTPIPVVRMNLAQLLESVRAEVPGDVTVVQTVLGSAALFEHATEADRECLCSGLIPPESTTLIGDALIAAFGARRGAPAVLAVAGTGSIGAALDANGRFYTAGGFGPLIGGDPGSAFWIAATTVREAAAMDAELSESKVIRRAICGYFDIESLHHVVPVVYGSEYGSGRLAGLAAHLAGDAEARDTVLFRNALRRAGEAMADMIRPILHCAPDAGSAEGSEGRVFIAGSVLTGNERVRDAFRSRLEKNEGRRFTLDDPELSPVRGAALMALTKAGQSISDGTVSRLNGRG